MSAISAFCFLICLVIIATMLWRRSDPFSPGRIFALIWLGMIGLADLKFSGYQSEWSLYAWVVIGVGIGSFLLGVFICYVLFMHRAGPVVGDGRGLVHQSFYNKQKAFNSIVGLFLLYIVCYAIEAVIMGQLPIFAPKADKARIEFGVFGIHLIVTSMPIILFFISQYFLLVKSEPRKKTVLAFIFFVTAISFFMLLQRFLFVTWLLITFSFYYYTSPQFKFRRIALIILMFWGMLQYILSFRVAIYVKNFLYVISRMRYSEKYAVFTEPYMYVVMNIENLARGVEKLQNFTYGYYTTNPLLALVGLKRGIAENFGFVERPFLISVYNTFPFMWDFYHDFGVLGIMVLPLALGIAIGIAYYSMRMSPNPLTVTIYSVCFYGIVISFFTNILTLLTTVFNIVGIIFLQLWISKPYTDDTAIVSS